jgi:hypothetical protein
MKVRQRGGIGSSIVLAMLGRALCAWLCAFSELVRAAAAADLRSLGCLSTRRL